MKYETIGGHRVGLVTVSEARQELADIINRVAYRGERIRLMRHGRAVAAIVPIDDVERLDGADPSVRLANRSAGDMQADADRAQIRRLVAMGDREREAYFFTSNRNMLRMMAEGRRST
jgi:prevent-host-death family protein